MKSFMALFAGVAVCALLFAAAPAQADDEFVMTIDSRDYKAALEKHPLVLGEFYAPWCGHCKKLAPEYEKAAEIMKDADPPVVLAKTDCTIETNKAGICAEMEVKGFPTLKFFRNGEPSEYTGGRDTDSIVAWLKKRTGPPAKLISEAKEVETMKKDAKVVVIGFYSESEDALVKAFEEAAQKSDDKIVFGLVRSADIAKELGEKMSSIVLFKQFDEGKNVLTSDLDNVEKIAEFIKGNAVPLVIILDETNQADAFAGEVRNILMSFSKDVDSIPMDLMKSIATDFKGKIRAVAMDGSNSALERIFQYFTVSQTVEEPVIRLINLEKMSKYQYDGSMEVSSVKSWVSDFFAGKISPFLKSQEPPAKQVGPMVTVVGKTFKEVVIDSDKDVFVEFYAPWCGHCKKLAPIWEQLAQEMKEVDSVVIAQFDADSNEVEEVSIQGFPTIKLFPANNKSTPIDYSGDRDNVQSFIDFLKENASIKFSLAGGESSASGQHEEL